LYIDTTVIKIPEIDMFRDSVKVFAPASVSNVGPGFDIMGFALDEPGDEIFAERNNTGQLRIKEIFGDDGKLPFDINQNTATVAIKSMLEKYKIDTGIDITIDKKMGIGSGLGSSAASAVGGVFAVNELLDLKLSKDELLLHALNGEAVASGAIHADNVAPSLFGGFLLVRDYNPIDIIKIPTPKDLYCTIIYPDIVVKTSEARKIIDKFFPVKDVVTQAGNSGALIAGLYSGDYDLISRSLVDKIAEHKRASFLPFYDDIRDKGKELNAVNCNISGSGPSLFSFSRSLDEADTLASELKKIVLDYGFDVKTYVSQINQEGPRILD